MLLIGIKLGKPQVFGPHRREVEGCPEMRRSMRLSEAANY
jgi:hypothetical protein